MSATNNSPLLSHPERFLYDHTAQVIKLALQFLTRIPNYDGVFQDLLKIITFSHDIGKSTRYFQEYIKNTQAAKNKRETQHALFGAFVSFYLAHRYFIQNKQNHDDSDREFLLLLSFILPRRHHSNLKNFLSELYIDDDEKELLEKQRKAIEKDKLEEFFQNLQLNYKDHAILKFSLDDLDFSTLSEELERLRRYVRKLKHRESLAYYLHTVLFFSLLIDADKSDVGIKTDKAILFPDHTVSPDWVDRFVSTLGSQNTTINELRQRAFHHITTKPIDLNQKIYTLTLPTGIGKTLISLKIALKIAEKAKREQGRDLRIIYTLPFLSIIEQNYHVIENVLKTNGIQPNSLLLLKHHHLTGTNYRVKDEEFDFDTSRILIEGWNAKIIVTTFIQFFYTLIGNRNRMLRKFHRLANSIVILDEIQSIPHKYWLLLKNVLYEMSQRFNFYIILSTATQPMIFEEGQFSELAPREFFSKINRYNVFVDKTHRTIEEFCHTLALDKNKTYLFILNTVNSAKKLYDLLKAQGEEDILFLSTHIVPKERLRRIQEVKAQGKRIAVSTQLVEAGVDVDFDVVYRDFAPFDSLNQSAGRCNREGAEKKGEFHIIKLYDEKNNRPYFSYIYDSVLIDATDNILAQDSYTEQEFIALVNEYYKLLTSKKSDAESLQLLEMLYSLTFSAEKTENKITSIEDFVLIEEDRFKQDVFIELDDEAKEVWAKYCQIWKIADIFERKKVFDNLKGDFYQYVISVPIRENEPLLSHHFYYVPFSSLDQFYDREIGYKTEGQLYWTY